MLPTEDLYEVEEAGSSRAWPMLALLALLVGGVGYWTLMRQEPAVATTASEPGDALPPAELNAAPVRRELSAQERAWNAAAATRDPEPKSDTTDTTPAPTPLADPELTPALEDMVDRAMPSIVLVETTTGRGSAFFVQHDTLITNVHVVQQDSYVTLRRMDGTGINARVHTRAPAFDIAILKVATASPSQPVLPMGSAQSLKPGQEVVVIGSALGTLQNSVSRGIVSGVRNNNGITLVQSDAAANPGNSGGPMLDRNGRVVGILAAGYRNQQGLNFAVSIDHARDILEGRETNLGSAQTGFSNIQPTMPGGPTSESDRRQRQGEEEFNQRVASLDQAAAQLDAAWQRFRSQCFTSRIPGSYDREWFAVFAAGAMPADAAAGCGDYYKNMTGEMNKFRDYMRRAVQDARRANLLPGTIRDTLRAKRLQSDAWDR